MGWCAGGLLISPMDFRGISCRPSPSGLSPAARAAQDGLSQALGPPPPSCSRPPVPIEDGFKKASPHAWKRSGREKGVDPSRDVELLVRRRVRGSGRRTRSPAVGPSAARAQAPRATSADRLGLHFRRDLSEGEGKGFKAAARHAALRHRGDEPSPGRDRHANRARRTRRDPRRSRPDGISPAG